MHTVLGQSLEVAALEELPRGCLVGSGLGRIGRLAPGDADEDEVDWVASLARSTVLVRGFGPDVWVVMEHQTGDGTVLQPLHRQTGAVPPRLPPTQRPGRPGQHVPPLQPFLECHWSTPSDKNV